VILSVPSLWHSFTHSEEGYHLGFHEFAHLLTYERGRPITVPIGLSPARIQLWEQIQADEVNRIVAGDSVIDQYGLQPSEFFPCAVEIFFQKPIELRERHSKLYRFLGRYFRQSPATWESKLRARISAESRA
jgi:Mlc titration factor MtfA (ptsG expression regulator)